MYYFNKMTLAFSILLHWHSHKNFTTVLRSRELALSISFYNLRFRTSIKRNVLPTHAVLSSTVKHNLSAKTTSQLQASALRLHTSPVVFNPLWSWGRNRSSANNSLDYIIILSWQMCSENISHKLVFSVIWIIWEHANSCLEKVCSIQWRICHT